MKLKPHGVRRERATREPCPLDRVLALLDTLLGRSALVVEGDDVLRASQQVGHDEADARKQLAGVPLDFGDNAARLVPAPRLITESRVQALDVMRRPTYGSLEEMSDLVLQYL